MRFRLHDAAGIADIEVPVSVIVIAGWSGRDRAADLGSILRAVLYAVGILDGMSRAIPGLRPTPRRARPAN